ncbi:MAG: hypothetical protein ACI8ZN_000828 [Bacteroidia bacterium]|jgi:hypothetical protein
MKRLFYVTCLVLATITFSCDGLTYTSCTTADLCFENTRSKGIIVYINDERALIIDSGESGCTTVDEGNTNIRIEKDKIVDLFPVISDEWLDVEACEIYDWVVD